jgi:tRNA(His) 5'-end guanylyltransferase
MSIRDIFKGIFDKAYKTLGERMKAYEQVDRKRLGPKTPVIIRLDGRAFHTYTQGFKKPHDPVIIEAMKYTATKLCEEVQNVRLAYSQSDEITLFLADYGNKNTQQWFDGERDKMVSLSASIATYYFNDYMDRNHWSKNPAVKKKPATFDSRVFNLPRHEVVNNFVWRQQDAIRNSIQGLAQFHFNERMLLRKSTAQMLTMLMEKGIDWEEQPIHKQRGFCVTKEYSIIDVEELNLPDNIKINEPVKRAKWVVDDDVPVFSDDKSYIDILVMIGEIENKYE